MKINDKYKGDIHCAITQLTSPDSENYYHYHNDTSNEGVDDSIKNLGKMFSEYTLIELVRFESINSEAIKVIDDCIIDLKSGKSVNLKKLLE